MTNTLCLPEIDEGILTTLGISYDYAGEEPCVVSYPEPCDDEAAMTVYGLGFCERHGLEAALSAIHMFLILEEEFKENWEEDMLARWSWGEEYLQQKLESEVFEVITDVLRRPSVTSVQDSRRLVDNETYSAIANLEPEARKAAYPLKEERFHPLIRECLAREGEGYRAHDYFMDQLGTVRDLMIFTHNLGDTEAVRRLEPHREWAVAQFSYADALWG